MLVLPLQFPLPTAENIAASLDMGSVITSVSLTAIGAVLDYCLARPLATIRKILLMNFMPIPVRYWRNKWHRSVNLLLHLH